jgi:predicted site-specific integrase-resolvase
MEGTAMSFEKTWYTLNEAAEKFGMEKGQILKWVEDGLIRAEESDEKVVRVNVDDLDLKVQELTGI